VLDVTIHPAHHVALERRQYRLAIAFEGECPRLVQAVDLRLAEPPTERPSDQPLQLRPRARPDRQEVRQPSVHLVGLYARTL